MPGKPSLMLLGTALNAGWLRAKFPDTRSVVILPAILSIQAWEGSLTAVVSDLPSRIHVPLPWSDQFRAHPNSPFRIQVTWGSSYEPWVTGLDFPTAR